ncbi:multidrug resistance protein mrp-7-like [Amblyomma americanum]
MSLGQNNLGRTIAHHREHLPSQGSGASPNRCSTAPEEPSELVGSASVLLKWAFLGSSLLSAAELVQRPDLSPRRPVCVTLVDFAYLLCNMFTAATVFWANATSTFPGRSHVVSDVAVAVAVVWLTASAICQRWKGLCASNFLWALHAIHFVAAASELLAIRLMFSWTRNEDLAAATWRSLLALTTLGSFLFSGFRSSPVVDKDTLQIRRDADEETFSSCGKLSGSAVLRLVVNAGLLSKHVDSDVLPPVRRLKCGQLVACLPSPLVQKWTGPNARIRVFCAFVRVLWHEALWVPLVGLAYFAALIVRVPLLESLIEDVGSQAAKAVSALFLCSCAAEVCLSGFLEYVALRFSTQLKLLMEAALFTKMTRMSASALSEAPAGYLVSLVGVDCDQLHTAVLFFSQALSGLLCLPVVLWMLSKRVGVPPVAGCIAWPLASLALSVPVSWIQRGLWKRIVHYRDERLNKMADTLSCVRLVKFYAWEGAVTAAVSRWRAREGRFLFLSNLLDGFVDSLQSSSNSVMTLILLGTFAAVNQSVTLSAAHLFSALYMLSIMDIVFVNMPTVLRYRSMVSQGLQRMAKTLTAEEDEFGACARNNHEVENGAVLLENCTFAWSGPQEGSEEASGSDEPALCDVSLDVTPGALVGVVGLVGSGKSALLAAILGELRRLRGTVHVAGRVAYLPQSACIFNMSIRDNVLFGRRMETYRYHQVLEACDLTRDLELLPAGDLTEVGEKGETLSGGQKQRVALARAVYSNSDVYLIDDTLSGLDVHVAAKVFARVIGPDGLLRHKTRIMVCNQGVFLNDVDKLLLLSKKRVHLYVSLSDLKADTEVPKALLFGSKQVSPTAKPKDNR